VNDNEASAAQTCSNAGQCLICSTSVFVRSGTGLIPLLMRPLFILIQKTKKPKRRRFKSDRGEIWQECTSS